MKASGFQPVFTISPEVAGSLMRVGAVNHTIKVLPMTPRMLEHLRETARLASTHYSTMIEGNLLTQVEVAAVVGGKADPRLQAPGRERDRQEVRGYFAALEELERIAQTGTAIHPGTAVITEKCIQGLHGLVMGAGKARVKPTPYRDGQNVIKDSRSGGIVYMPPEAKDVPRLMSELFAWLNVDDGLPVPLKAAIAHYQYATIHPYYDGNGRTARLLTTLILHVGGYGLKGFYALEEYYARDLAAYYEALNVGTSHNYYLGRASADITRWIAYFLAGMADAFEKVEAQARRELAAGTQDRVQLLRRLDARQRKALGLFERSREVTAKEIARLFGLQPRSASELCQRWVAAGFLLVADASKKARRYRLIDELENRFAGL